MDGTTNSKNIIRIKTFNNKDRRRCPHKEIVVDELKTQVECGLCGEQLNPVAILARIAAEQNSWNLSMEGIRDIAKRMEDRRKTKCEFCHKMTRISQ